MVMMLLKLVELAKRAAVLDSSSPPHSHSFSSCSSSVDQNPEWIENRVGEHIFVPGIDCSIIMIGMLKKRKTKYARGIEREVDETQFVRVKEQNVVLSLFPTSSHFLM